MALNYLQRMAGNLGLGMGRRGMGVDPRRRMAQQLMAQGADTSPAHLGTGIGRLGKALAAAYMMRQSEDQETDAMKWLTAKQPTTQPTETEAYAASPDLGELKRASDVFSTVQWGSGQDQVQPDGLEKDLFKSGELKEETNWLDGLRHGKNTEYNEDGSVKKAVMWDRGKETSRTEDKSGTPAPSDLQLDKDFGPSEDLSEDSLFTADPELPETPQEITSPYGQRDYAQELASGMGAYQRDPANQISDPRTRMEWLRDSASGKEDNPFVRRMLQNMMFSEMGLGKEKSGYPASGIQYFDRKQELINKGATQAELDDYDSYVRRAQVFDLGDSYQVRSGINPQGAQPTTINKNLPLEKKIPYVEEVTQKKAERKIEGENIAEARWDAPQANREVSSMVSLLDQIYTLDKDGKVASTHPGFEDVIGATWLPGKRLVHGTKAFALDKLVKQVKDKNFLQAFQALKGGGHITEIEGDKATDSIAAIHIGMPEVDFIVEMEKVRSVLMKGLSISQGKIDGTIQHSGQEGLRTGELGNVTSPSVGDRRGKSNKGRVAPGFDPEDWKYLNEEEKKAAWGDRR